MIKKIILFLFIPFCLGATIINVPTEYSTIDSAVTNAIGGDTVLVDTGTYAENVDIDSSIVVLSNYYSSGNWSDVENTIIDASGSGDRPLGLWGDVVFDGFTLKNGDEPILGGGVYIDGNSSIVRNCIIDSNKATDEGGGVLLRNFSGSLQNCIIKNNTSNNATGSPCEGGGIAVKSGCSNGTIEGCLIYNNIAIDDEVGGGIAIRSDISIINCTITKNKANIGEGIYVFSGADPNITNCIIADNECDAGDAGEVYGVDSGGGTIIYTNVYDADGDEVFNVSTGTGYISEAPVFADTSIADFTLDSTSTSIGVGINDSVNVSTDLAGNTRIQNTVDLGAYETSYADPVADTGWSKTINGITNVSKINGIDVTNILKVNGIE